MKILKIFGIVAALHVVAFVLIFANPGCQSKGAATASAPPDTATAPAPATVSYPGPAPSADSSALAPAPVDPNAPLNNAALNPGMAPAGSATVSFNGGDLSSPTRPGTPLAQALTAAPTTGVVPASTYTVGHGDSLWSVAKKHHVSVSELARANNLKTSSSLRLGQKLIIPGGTVSAAPAAASGGHAMAAASAPAPAASNTERAGEVVHVVRAGETLGAIARHYQVSLGDLATANNISDPAKIRPGQKLVIPGFKAVGAKSRKKSAEAPAAAPAVAPAPAPVNPAVAPAPQDLDSGSPPPANPGDAPVIKVDNSGASAPQIN